MCVVAKINKGHRTDHHYLQNFLTINHKASVCICRDLRCLLKLIVKYYATLVKIYFRNQILLIKTKNYTNICKEVLNVFVSSHPHSVSNLCHSTENRETFPISLHRIN